MSKIPKRFLRAILQSLERDNLRAGFEVSLEDGMLLAKHHRASKAHLENPPLDLQSLLAAAAFQRRVGNAAPVPNVVYALNLQRHPRDPRELERAAEIGYSQPNHPRSAPEAGQARFASQIAAIPVSVSVYAPGERKLNIFHPAVAAVQSGTGPLAQEQILIVKSILLMDVWIGRDHKREMRRNLPGRFPLPIVVAVPGRDAKLPGKLGKGRRFDGFPARSLIENNVKLPLPDFIGQCQRGPLPPECSAHFIVVESLNVVSHLAERHRKIKMHRLDRRRHSIVIFSDNTQDAHE